MSEIMIRQFELLDLADFKDLCDKNDFYYPQVSISSPSLWKYEIYRNNCYVAYDNSKLVGYVYGAVVCDTLYPHFMFVREEYRKQGIGKKLMESLEQNCNCSLSMIYYNNILRTYYQKQNYIIGTNLEVGIKQLNKTQ